jgi:hypothetical protein
LPTATTHSAFSPRRPDVATAPRADTHTITANELYSALFDHKMKSDFKN